MKQKKNIDSKVMYTNKLNLYHKRNAHVKVIDNDRSAGSPTETLLRLLFPLGSNLQIFQKIQQSFRNIAITAIHSPAWFGRSQIKG